jgi:hypothetical protein
MRARSLILIGVAVANRPNRVHNSAARKAARVGGQGAMQVYRKRDYWEDREDSEWRIDTDALVYRDAIGQEYRFPWKGIVGVRAERRRRSQQPCHTCSVWLAGEERSRCEFDNLHVVTVGEYEYQEDYPAFLKAVLMKVIEKSPGVRAWTGMHRGIFPWAVAGVVLYTILALIPVFDGGTTLAFRIIGPASAALWIFILIRDRPKAISVGELLQRV